MKEIKTQRKEEGGERHTSALRQVFMGGVIGEQMGESHFRTPPTHTPPDTLYH